jgi:hypothetical protein
LYVVVGFCDREYSAELIFELVDGLWSDHAVQPCQFVSEGDQRVVRPLLLDIVMFVSFLLLFLVGER